MGNSVANSSVGPGLTPVYSTLLAYDWTSPAKEDIPKPRTAVHRKAVIAQHECPLCDQRTSDQFNIRQIRAASEYKFGSLIKTDLFTSTSFGQLSLESGPFYNAEIGW